LSGWYFLYRRQSGEPKRLWIVGRPDDDPDATEMTDKILWVDAGQAWALCTDGFWWLRGDEQPRLGDG
jgi:hypothetical protein